MMRRSLSTQKKGGVSGAKRLRYTARQKLNLLCALDELHLRDGLSIRAAAKILQTSRVILARWKRARDLLYRVKQNG